MALNVWTGTGRLTARPEQRRMPNSNAVTTFCIAVERDFKDKNTGIRGVDFINCVSYSNTAEMIAKYYDKGMLVNVTGRLQIRKYKTKEGQDRYTSEIIVNQIYFGESKKKNSSESDEYQSEKSKYNDDGWTEVEPEDYGGRLPF